MLFVCLLNIFTKYKNLVLCFSSAEMHFKIEGRLSTNREMHSLSVRHTVTRRIQAMHGLNASCWFVRRCIQAIAWMHPGFGGNIQAMAWMHPPILLCKCRVLSAKMWLGLNKSRCIQHSGLPECTPFMVYTVDLPGDAFRPLPEYAGWR